MKIKFRALLATVLMGGLLVSGCGANQSEPVVPEGSQEIVISNAEKVETDYDCIVVDGSPEGISAAISAARNGLKTLLICQDAALGGLYTLGELNFIDVPESRSGQLLVGGIYKEFSDAVGGSGFDIIKAKNTFYQMVANEDNLTLRVNSRFKKPLMDGQTITGIEVEEDGKNVKYHAPVVIDATPDGNVCAAADVPYTFAGEDIGERDREMGVTLVFRLSGVDWDKVTAHVTKIPEGETAAEGDVNGNLAWGYSKEGFAYEPTDEAMRLRGFNIARQDNGDVLLNALIIFDVDALDPASCAEGIARGEAELPMIIDYMRAHCEGFEKATLVNTAEQLYVRETRHMECEKMLTIDDVLENRAQEDAICVTNYPVDVQATKTQRFGTVVGFPDQYEISFGSLVPKKVDGLMIVGRSAGFTSLAAGSARIVPTGMACGQAAGVAAKLCVDKDMTPRELYGNEKGIKKMQKTLEKQGALLAHQETEEPVMSHWAYEGLKVIRSMGYADGGYDNNYRLDDEVTGPRFCNLVNLAIKKSGLSLEERVTVSKEPDNAEMLLALSAKVAGLEGVAAPTDFEGATAFFEERKVLDQTLSKKFADGQATADAGSCYMLAARLYEHLLTQPNAIKYVAINDLSK